MNYKKRDDELIKLNKQVQNMKNSATNKSLSSQKSGTYGSTRKEVPYVKPNKASEMNTTGTTKPSTRYQNQTAGQTAPKKTRDTRYDKDFDEFHKYRVGDMIGVVDYDPVSDRDVEHWRNLKTEIMAKNKWTEKEFDTKWDEYYKERSQKEADQEVNDAVKFAKEHPVLGTLLQGVYTPQNMIEGGAVMLSNIMPDKYKAQSANDTLFTGTRAKEGIKQAVKDEHIDTGLGKALYDVGTSVGDMAFASGVPVLGAATMGAETAARTNMEALERGASANRAAATAGISGLVSGAMNKIGLDKAAGAEAKTALGKVIKGAGVEAAENMLEDSANLAVDTLINTDKSQLSALHDYYTSQGLDDKSAWNRVMLDTARDMAVSGVSGAAFGGVMNGLHNLPSLIPEVRDLTKGLKMNDVGGVDAPALLEEARAAMKAPAKVGNKLEFEPVEGEIRDKLQAEFDANTEQISKNETEIATLRELETTGSKRNQNRYKKQREALEKENRVLEGQQPELRKMLDGYRSTFKGELSKEDANAIFDDRNGGVNNWLNLGVKFAGETDEAKALRKEAKKAIRAYVESGNIDDWHNAVKYIGDLSNLADEARIPYRTQDGKVYNYEDVFDSAETDYLGRPVQGTMFDKIYNGNTVPNIVNALHERIVPRVEGEPNRIPEPTGESAPTNIEPTAEPIPEQPVDNVPALTPEEMAELQDELASEGYDWSGEPETINTPNEPPVNNTPPVNNVPPTEPPLTSEPPRTDKIGKSLVGLDTAVNSNVFTKDQINNHPVISKMNEYAKASNDLTYNQAKEDVIKDGDTLLEEYTSGRREIKNDLDVDRSMIMLTELSERVRSGETNLEAKRNLLFSRLRRAGTLYGQTIQAFKKWNRTAEGAIANGEGIIGDRVKAWKSNNVKKTELNGRIAKALEQMGVDSSMRNKTPQEKTHAQVKEGVKNVLAREFGSIEQYFNDNDLEYLATLAEDKSIPTWKITDEIEHKLSTGEWYTLDESIEPKYPVNQRLKSALDSLVDNEPAPVKEPPTLDEIRNQVRATLDQEYANRRETGDFTDEDVEYLANLINEGATKDELADALNTKMATGKFGISAETQQAVSDMFRYANNFDPDSQKAYDLRTAAYKMLANEAVSEDASPFEKFDSWRYLAMLGNPKTWVRNKVGNEMFNAVTGVSNNISAALEAATDRAYKALGGEGIQRTKTFLNPVDDRALIKAAAEDGDNYRYSVLNGTKYERGIKDAIKQQKSVFNNKALRAFEAVTDWGISDYKNVKRKYGTSLAGYMKANGLDESAFDADARYRDLKDKSRTQLLTDAEKAEMNTLKSVHDDLEKARDYAVKQAEYATFHEDNKLASWLSKSSKDAPGVGRLVIEGLVPFKKTPANILRSGFEYSPLGAIKSIKETGKLVYENTGKRKGNLEDTYKKKNLRGETVDVNKSLASDVLDSWSKTLTGSGLMALGYYLKNKGVLNSSTDDEKWQDDLEGKQNYSITINGKTYTVDWAAPAIMPMLIGAELSKIKDRYALSDEKFYENIDDIADSVNAILDPLIETSMLQNVKSSLEELSKVNKYSDDTETFGGAIGAALMNAGTGYLTQAIPTVSGQIARTVDNTRRTTDTATDSTVFAPIEKQGRKVMNKIPGLSFLNTPYYDSYGRTQNQGFDNPIGRLLYQTLSPAYIRSINVTPADEQAREVYNATQNKDVFPSWKSTKKVNGEKLNPQEMATYRKASGEAQYAIRDALAKEEWFKGLETDEQEKILKKVNTLVDKIGLEEAGYPQNNKDLAAYQEGGIEGVFSRWGKPEYGVPAVTETKTATTTKTEPVQQTTKTTTPAKTNTQQTTAKSETVKVDTAKQQKYIDRAGRQSRKYTNDLPKLEQLNFSSAEKYTYAYAINQDGSLTPEKFDAQFDKMDLDNSGSMKQDEMIEYFNRNNISQEQGQYLWKTYGDRNGEPWKTLPVLKNGTWKKKK